MQTPDFLALPAWPRRFALLQRGSWGQALTFALIGAFLATFLVVPVVKVIYVAFTDGAGHVTLTHFQAFFARSLFREAFYNSLSVALMSVLLASLLAVPLAYLTVRFRFRGLLLIQTLGVLPLIMPSFVGAVALQLLFGRSGSANLVLEDYLGLPPVPIMEGLNGVIFVETIHYFPFILLNLSAALANIDGAMEEAAQNLGCHGWRLFRRVVFPLALPGYVAGATLVFIKVFDDLGTPLVLDVPNLLAPQAYFRITSIGLHDPSGYVISVIMVAFSLFALYLSHRALEGREFATLQRGYAQLQQRELRGAGLWLANAFVVATLLLVLSPHLGVLLLSVGKVWSFTLVPEAYTFAHYEEVFRNTPHFIVNTIWYAGLAGLIDVLLGVGIAYLMLRSNLPGRRLLDFTATAALAVPGVVLGIGYLRTFNEIPVPFMDKPLAGTWMILVIAYTVRRLPYALRSCVASLSQSHVSLEEAAENLGANTWHTVRRVVVPLMIAGILAGFISSFMTAAVELSATLMLNTGAQGAPLSYGIYLYLQTAAGRGSAAALGVIAVVIVALGTYLSHRLLERRSGSAFKF